MNQEQNVLQAAGLMGTSSTVSERTKTVTVYDPVVDPDGSKRGLAYRVEVQPDGVFYATTPYRSCAYMGGTKEEAIGSLLMGVGLLSRDGHFNPNEPESMGVPPIQHAIDVMSERLCWQIDRRREKVAEAQRRLAGPGDQLVELPNSISRDSDVVSALSTAIAALARVKDL